MQRMRIDCIMLPGQRGGKVFSIYRSVSRRLLRGTISAIQAERAARREVWCNCLR